MTEGNGKMKWWEGNVDEMFIGACIACVAIGSYLFLPEKGSEVGTGAIAALGVYLGMKSSK